MLSNIENEEKQEDKQKNTRDEEKQKGTNEETNEGTNEGTNEETNEETNEDTKEEDIKNARPTSETESDDSKPKPNDTILELQLGDVIHITNPLNDELNDQTFIIDYIDKSKVYLINTTSMTRIRLSITPDGTLGDGNITRIAILSRSDSPSYARQNELLPETWINVYFGGDFPVIITGEITNLENDMIEIKTVDGDVIYINFDYKGIPDNLPIEMIEIREKPVEPLSKEQKDQDQQQKDQQQKVQQQKDQEQKEESPEI